MRSEIAKINVKNSEFLNNKSSGKGGAFATYSREYPYFENCTFRGNKASEDGGAIKINTVGHHFRNNTFVNNEASLGTAIAYSYLKAVTSEQIANSMGNTGL